MDKEGLWIPVTPMKPGGAEQSIQIRQANWEELNEFSGKSIGGFDLWEADMGFTDLLELANVATTSDPVNGAKLPNVNADCASASNLYEDLIPSRLSFDLNSIPISTAEDVSPNISSKFVPFTPDQSNKQAYKVPNLNNEVAERTIEVIEIDDDEDDSDYSQGKDQARTQLQENHNPDEGIDLSKTPQQQKPRRRKHRPKVVREGGKPARPQKATTPKTVSPKEPGSSGKRKYVRRKAIEKPQANTPSQQMNAGPAEDKTAEGTKRSCRRPLHFDNNNIYNEVRDESSSYRPPFTFGTESHAQNFSGRVQSEVDASTIRKNRILFTDGTHDKETMMNTYNSTSCSGVSLYNGEQGRGLKRINSSTTHGAVNVSGSRYNSLQAFGATFPENTCMFVGMHFPAICKKKRTEKVHTGMVISGASTVTAVQNQLNATSGPAKAASTSGVEDNQRPLQCMLTFNQVDNMLKKKRSKGPTRVRDYASLIGMIPMVSRPVQPNTCMEALAAGPHAKLARKKRTKRNPHVNRLPLAIYNRYQRIKKPRGRPYGTKRRAVYSVESLIEQFGLLNLSAEQQTALVPYNMRQKKRYHHYKDKNALVLYQRNGEVVPFNGPLKIRKPRPKVDLDDETSRVWKLLLQDINSVGVDGNDEDKAKWWEEERSVFRGRAESFIARMHLVQGDRRFSKWKGSVVDSCVGVFLTQNVSDHLSSSAFMALAARYPLKSKTSNNQSDEEETTELDKQPEFHVTEPEDTIEWTNNKSDQPAACQQSSITIQDAEYNEEKEEINSDESFGSTSDRASSKKPVNFSEEKESMKLGDNREQDDVISSQNSVVSSQNSADSPSIAQNVSCSPSSSDTEPASVKSNESSGPTSFLELLRMAHRVFNDKSGSEPSDWKLPLENPQKQDMGPANDCQLHLKSNSAEAQSCDNTFREESRFSDTPTRNEEICGASEQSGVSNMANETSQSQTIAGDPKVSVPNHIGESPQSQTGPDTPNFSGETSAVTESTSIVDNSKCDTLTVESNLNTPNSKGGRAGKEKPKKEDWDILRKVAQETHGVRKRDPNTMDSVDWETIRNANVNEIAYTIRERGMNNMLAERIKDFLNRLVREHGSVNLEWLRDVPPDKAKEYLLSFRGLGLKSVECVRLLTLHHLAFPVDTNVGRIAVRLGWVPLQPLPESLQLHLLELYPVLETIQKFLWPRLCKLDQPTLYELHYQMITFGKVFCTKSKPNCNACPMRGECRHFASAFASARLALPAPEEKSIVPATGNIGASNTDEARHINTLQLPAPQPDQQLAQSAANNCGPIIEEPASPEPIIEVPQSPEPERTEITELDIEDGFEDPDEIPTIKLNIEQFSQNLQNYMQQNMELQEGDMSKALVALTQEAASLPTPKLKNISRLRTEHQVYELPDSHPLLEGLEKREPDDPSSYLLAIWTPGETPDTIQPPEGGCNPHETGILCKEKTCFSCNNIRESNSQTVRGTLLIPCRTAMRGSFPLNGTYFQVNEVFADHDSSLKPIDVPRSWIWNLPRRTVYFGTSIPTIFKGLTTEGIQYCFWRGFVCVRGFDQKSRAPRPLMARLHFPASKMVKTKGKPNEE